jgi:hypothetical protein
MTTDGAPNERLSSALVVQQDNDLHYANHIIQLVVNDVLDGKKANPAPGCAKHRAVVAKANKLAV